MNLESGSVNELDDREEHGINIKENQTKGDNISIFNNIWYKQEEEVKKVIINIILTFYFSLYIYILW